MTGASRWFCFLQVAVIGAACETAFAQEASTVWACDDQKSWCDKSGNVVAPTPVEIAEQCNRYPSSCKNRAPIQLADSGCVDPEGWGNYCTDQGKLRDPTAEEIYANEHCGETIDGVTYTCE